jgi:hypothetical protein
MCDCQVANEHSFSDGFHIIPKNELFKKCVLAQILFTDWYNHARVRAIADIQSLGDDRCIL